MVGAGADMIGGGVRNLFDGGWGSDGSNPQMMADLNRFYGV